MGLCIFIRLPEPGDSCFIAKAFKTCLGSELAPNQADIYRPSVPRAPTKLKPGEATSLTPGEQNMGGLPSCKALPLFQGPYL